MPVDLADFTDVLDNVHPRLPSQTACTMHQRREKLQAEKRAMGVIAVREERSEGGHLIRLTIDNAKKLNTLGRALMVEIVEAIERLEADRDLRLVVLTGAGERAFVGGADITELATLDEG